MPRRGLYEQLLTHELEEAISALDDSLVSQLRGVHKAEVADRVSLHLAGVIYRAIQARVDKERVGFAVALADDIVDLVAGSVARSVEVRREKPVSPAQVLEAVVGRRPDGTPEDYPEPLMPLLDTALLTNSRGEPGVGQQLKAEIGSADRIDIVMAFIRLSGLRPLLEPLKRHCAVGKKLRVITTTYTGTTELKALEALEAIGAEVRVSYDLSSTRLHAKAWLLHRDSGFSTTFIGSSNLTHQAHFVGQHRREFRFDVKLRGLLGCTRGELHDQLPLRETDRAFWFLGPAKYVSHTGERPMAVTWKLAHPLPGDLFASFAAAVA